MGVIETKVFKSGNSAAVRLPKELGFEPGTLVRIEKTARGLDLRVVDESDAALRNNQALAAELQAIWDAAPFREVQTRESIEAPDRPGLL